MAFYKYINLNNNVSQNGQPPVSGEGGVMTKIQTYIFMLAVVIKLTI